MPKGSKLEGLSKKEATGKAWGYCKKNVFENSNIDKVIKEAKKELKELEHE